MTVFQRIRKQLHRDEPGQLKREILWLISRVKRHWVRILIMGILGLTQCRFTRLISHRISRFSCPGSSL